MASYCYGFVNFMMRQQHNTSVCVTEHPAPSFSTSQANLHPASTGNQQMEAPQCTNKAWSTGNSEHVNCNLNSMSDTNAAVIDFDVHEVYENDEIKTLEDAVRKFWLFNYLERLDISLEELRRCKITKNEHEKCFKEIDKEIMKLALLYHPDAVMRRKGTENEIKTSHHLQTALNSLRTALSYLNAAFLADIRTDHKFQFYTKLNITSLCDENDVKSRIYEMKFRLSMISRIKQQNIILEIRKFLIESKKCLSYYIDGNEDEFKNSCCSVLFHLNQCIEGFEKLHAELAKMVKQCKVQKDNHMLLFIQNMATDINRDIKLLDILEKSAKSSMNGNFQFFSTEEFIDPYFVRPLVWYTNLTILCYTTVINFSLWKKASVKISRPKFIKFWELRALFFLTAYYCGDKRYEYAVKKFIHIKYNIYFFIKIHESYIISTFHDTLKDINKRFGTKFNIDMYTEVKTEDNFELELEKFASMMNEFEKKKQDLSESIDEVWIKTGEIKEKHDDIIKTSKNLDSKIEKIAEANSQIEAVIEDNKSIIQELLEASKKLKENSQ